MRRSTPLARLIRFRVESLNRTRNSTGSPRIPSPIVPPKLFLPEIFAIFGHHRPSDSGAEPGPALGHFTHRSMAEDQSSTGGSPVAKGIVPPDLQASVRDVPPPNPARSPFNLTTKDVHRDPLRLGGQFHGKATRCQQNRSRTRGVCDRHARLRLNAYRSLKNLCTSRKTRAKKSLSGALLISKEASVRPRTPTPLGERRRP